MSLKGVFYFFTPCEIKRKENTIFVYPLKRDKSQEEKEKKGKKEIKTYPIEATNEIFLFNESKFNSHLFNFLGKKGVVVHFFDFYGNYTGSFYPYHNKTISGITLVKQVEFYLDTEKRLYLAKEFINSAFSNMCRLLSKKKDYTNSNRSAIENIIEKIKEQKALIKKAQSVQEVMQIEAVGRKHYYSVFSEITGWEMEKRSFRPPHNPLNALISFGNSLLYCAILKEIHKTPLNPTISYLHEPSERRFSLNLDISEIFKPIFVDALIFRLINLNIIQPKYFIKELNFCALNEEGRKIFVYYFDKELNEKTIYHKKLKRRISNRGLIRLELYKLIHHLFETKKYKGFKWT